jgi:thiol:disulfide interchange protein
MIAKCFRMMMVLAALTLALPAAAQGPVNTIKATLLAESQTPVAGSTVMLAVQMQPEAGWHGYWQNPGDAGAATQLDWKLQKGATTGGVRYPVPERFVTSGLMNHVFNSAYALLVPLKIPDGLAAGTALPLHLVADWLGCTDKICVPQHGEMALTLHVGNGAVEDSARAQFDGWRAHLPRPLGGMAHFSVEGGKVRIGVPLPATVKLTDPWFFASIDGAVDYVAPQSVTRDGDMLIIETKAGAKAASLSSVEGVLSIGPHQGLTVIATPAPVAAGHSNAGLSALLLALGGAILGGFLLNIMPCVFPVIGLKAMSLARAGGNERAAKREALAYAAGVIAVCLALGGTMLALRAGGAAVGWAFQLQDPRVILVLIVLVTAIALNLAGLFELRGFGGGQELVDKGGATGAFWTGALAAFVATPCTGPFMAAAMGAALILPIPAALMVFAGLGLGLAAPFLLIGFVPAIRRRLPRPGAWMARVQRILSIPMFLTAAALIWLLWRQTGSGGLLLGLGAAVAMAVAVTLVGRRAGGGLSPLVAALSLVAITAVAIPFLPARAVSSPTALEGTEPFSEARLAVLRASGKPIFLYFTADWCLTCKVNEKAAIERSEVASAFKAKGIITMVGDWTNGDPAISRFLEAQGRSGVPLYLFYKPGGTAPQVLPQVLTPGMLEGLAV